MKIWKAMISFATILILFGCTERNINRHEESSYTSTEQLSTFPEDKEVQKDIYYHIMDNGNSRNAESRSRDKEEFVKQMKEFHEKLKKEFTYREISFQPLQQLEFYDKDSKYIRRGSKINEEINIEGKETYVNTFYTITIDNYFSEKLKDYIARGTIFEKEHFQYQGGDIAIILGDSYQQYYDIGDLISYNYLSENLNFKVIGFWKKDTAIQGGSAKITLNEYICLPYFDVSTMDISDNSSKFQEIYYESRCMGYILANDNHEEIKKRVEKVAESCGLDYTITDGTSSVYIE